MCGYHNNNMTGSCHCCCCRGNEPVKPDDPSEPVKPVKPDKSATLSTFVKEPLWNITFPDEDPKRQGTPLTLQLSDLSSLKNPHFKITSDGLLLTVPANGFTTKNSKYSRTEFRELLADGSKASWSTTSGTHEMVVVTKVLKTTKNKPEVCIAQIHDANDDLCMVRYHRDGVIQISGPSFPKKDVMKVEENSEITIIITCSKGNIKITCNGKVFEMPNIKTTGCYFKAGNYLQSNTSFDAADDTAVVLLSRLSVKHE